MAWREREPLIRYVKHQRVVDARLRRVLLAAANSAKRELATLDPSGLRAAQLRLQQEQLRMWATIGNVIEEGIQGNVPIVANINEIFADDLLGRLGVASNAEFRRQMQAQAQNTIRTYLARQNLGVTLSERVYKNGLVANGRIDSLVNSHILRGSSAREIARDVVRFISPSTPGGASYAAMRLGRTELNNSFHQAANESYAANPFIEKVDWKLSASHPREDDCDDIAHSGPYLPNDVPDKPHPQCLCFTTPQVISDKEFMRRVRSGEFDEWAEGLAA